MDAELALLHVDDIKPHEETDKARLRRVRESISLSRTLFKPVIVDRQSYTIIDGHHRYQSLLNMGHKTIPVVLADYERDIGSINPPRLRIGLEARKVEDVVLSMAKRGPGRVVLKESSNTFMVYRDPLDVYYVLKPFVNNASIVDDKFTLVIPPQLKADDVRKAGSRGSLLPPRSTLHDTWLKRVSIRFRLE